MKHSSFNNSKQWHHLFTTLFTIFISSQLLAQTQLIPIDDTYVRGGSNQNSTFGSNTSLAVKTASGASSTRRSYLKFDLSTITETVTEATLKLTVASSNGSNTSSPNQYSVYFVNNDSWSETGLTWQNEPSPLNNSPFPEPIDTVTGVTGPAGTGVVLSFNITSSVIQELAGDKTLSLAIASNGSRLINFHSVESNGDSPILEVLTNVVQPPSNSSIVNQPDISTIMGSCDFEGDEVDTNVLNAIESIQAAALNYTRIGVFPNRFFINGTVRPESIDDIVLELYSKGITPMLLVEHNPDNGNLGSQQKWFTIGAAFAERFRPNSTFLTQNGITNWGITYYQAINEPLFGLNETTVSNLHFPVSDYLAATKGFADGVHSIESQLKVSPGGLQEVPLIDNYNPYMSGVGDMLDDGTLDALDIHRYFDRKKNKYSITNKNASHQALINQIRAQNNIDTNFRVWCTEYNARQAPNDNDNAKDFITATWDLLTVRANEGNGNVVSDFALAFRTYLPVSSNENLGMAVSDFPFLGNAKGIAHQMLAQITQGFKMIDADEAAGIDILEANNGNKMWVFHNREGWSNQVGNSFTITNIPASANVIEVYKHDSWNATKGSTGAPAPYQSLSTSGSSLQINGLSPGESYMFIAKANTSFNDMPTVNITSPNANTPFSDGDTITINVSAFDGEGIREVVIYAGPIRLKTITSPPYTVNWTDAPAGSSTILAIAKDNEGAISMVEKNIFVNHPDNGDNILATADTYIKGGNQTKDRNFGGSSSLLIKTAANPNLQRRIYLKFDISEYSSIQNATLRLRVASSGTAFHTVYYVPNDTWAEGTGTEENETSDGLKWSDTETSEFTTAINSSFVAPEGKWTNFDITSQASSEISEDGILALAIWTNSSTFIDYFSKESGLGNEPRLLIEGIKAQTSNEMTINAIDDSFIRGGNQADTNYGNDEVLKVKTSGNNNYTRKTFLKFNLSSFSGNINSAKLRLRVNRNDGGNGPNTVSFAHLTNDNWDENSITWSSNLSGGSIIATHPSNNQIAVGDWMELDITQIVQQEFSGDKILSLIVSSNGTGNLNFYSKENTANTPPQIIINENSNVAAKAIFNNDKIESEDFEYVISPNPVNKSSILSYDLNNTSTIAVKVTDINGRLVADYKSPNTRKSSQLLWSNIIGNRQLNTGMYLVKITHGQMVTTKKIIVK